MASWGDPAIGGSNARGVVCLAVRAARRVHLEPLPGHAPDLNPAEGLWNDLKRVELANLCAHNLGELAVSLRRTKERLRHKRTVIQACVRQAGYA